jgi:hypothetical protein
VCLEAPCAGFGNAFSVSQRGEAQQVL